MNLHKLIFTENACYKAGKKITVKGIMPTTPISAVMLAPMTAFWA